MLCLPQHDLPKNMPVISVTGAMHKTNRHANKSRIGSGILATANESSLLQTPTPRQSTKKESKPSTRNMLSIDPSYSEATLQTRKLWLVGGCRDGPSRGLPLTRPNVKILSVKIQNKIKKGKNQNIQEQIRKIRKIREIGKSERRVEPIREIQGDEKTDEKSSHFFKKKWEVVSLWLILSWVPCSCCGLSCTSRVG